MNATSPQVPLDSFDRLGEALSRAIAERDRKMRATAIGLDDLSKRLSLRKPSRLSPRLAYGRHRGPATDASRRAAVIIVIYPSRTDGVPCITLTRRPVTLSHHGGQICLPGGRIESGEDVPQAALREYHEELGVEASVQRIIGRLWPLYVFASDNLVETVIAVASQPTTTWAPDPVEVDQVIEVPLAALVELGRLASAGESSAADRDPSIRTVTRRRSRMGKGAATGQAFEFSFGYRAIEIRCVDGQVWEVWGATALLLEEFAGLLLTAIGRDEPLK